MKLPKRSKGCKDDAKAGGDANHSARTRRTYLDKVFSDEVREERLAGGRVPQALGVAVRRPEHGRHLIAGKHMKPDKAAEKWVKANREGERLAQVGLASPAER